MALAVLLNFLILGTWSTIQFLLGILSNFLAWVLAYEIGKRLGSKFTKATSEELRREDDVLLQATAFSQSVLVIILSLMSGEDTLRRQIIYFIIIVAVSFYALRAWAMIKDSSKYRYYSMIIFTFVGVNSVISLLTISIAHIPSDTVSWLVLIMAGALAIIVEQISRRRYGYKGIFLAVG